jgi:hypothetical protein
MSKDFPEMEYKPTAEAVELPEGIDALRLLQMEYRGKITLTYAQRRAAEACLPFERPKLGVVATTTMNSDTFAEMLERAIMRSGVGTAPKLIEHRQDESPKPSPAPIPPHGAARQGPVPDRRFRRS